jgi:hypothetical protein
MGLIYFDYQGKLLSHEGRYLVEVSKKNADGGERNLIESRISASSILLTLLNDLSEAGDVRISSPGPSEIEKARFDKMTKEEVFRSTNGAIYRVIEENA